MGTVDSLLMVKNNCITSCCIEAHERPNCIVCLLIFDVVIVTQLSSVCSAEAEDPGIQVWVEELEVENGSIRVHVGEVEAEDELIHQ